MTELGQKITTSDLVYPDAVHVATFPAIAKEDLEPGQDIGIVRESNLVDLAGENYSVVSGKVSHKIGKVDPFLKEGVSHGDRILCVLYPNTVTGMRHQWKHPDFWHIGAPVEAVAAIKKGADIMGKSTTDFIDCLTSFCRDGDIIYNGSDESYHDIDWDTTWKYFEIITGMKPNDTYCPFSCSC